MTQQQKEQILSLRACGASFGKIASVLGISVNTIKSYCKRNPVSNEPMPTATEAIHSERCPQCNAQLEQSPGHYPWDSDIDSDHPKCPRCGSTMDFHGHDDDGDYTYGEGYWECDSCGFKVTENDV